MGSAVQATRLVERLTAERSKTEGIVQFLEKSLLDEHGCASTAEAVAKLKQLETEKNQLTEELESLVAEFERNWGDVLGD